MGLSQYNLVSLKRGKNREFSSGRFTMGAPVFCKPIDNLLFNAEIVSKEDQHTQGENDSGKKNPMLSSENTLYNQGGDTGASSHV